MTDKRRDEMPDEIFATKDGRWFYAHTHKLEGTLPETKYTSADLSPPVPDDVADAVYRMRQHNKWRKGDDSVPMTDSVQLGLDIETVCRAASTPSAEVQSLNDARAAMLVLADQKQRAVDEVNVLREALFELRNAYMKVQEWHGLKAEDSTLIVNANKALNQPHTERK